MLPPLPLHSGDRNRTSPFAFTGNRFEFRMAGSSSSLGMPNTVLNTITAEAIDELTAALEAKLAEGVELDEAVVAVVKDSYNANKQIVFGGDGYSEEWHAEAASRGLDNLPSTPDALPCLATESTVAVMSKYGVLSKRELEARLEVAVEQYITKLNIEAETTVQIARTMILPAGGALPQRAHGERAPGPHRRAGARSSARSTRRSSRSRRPTRTRACTASTSPST